nr:hypothetical protein [uncultured Pedobacter sp.]
MKKFVLSAFILAFSFILFSFTTVSQSNGKYNIVAGNIKFIAGSAGSFTEYWSHGTEKDVTWKDYVRTWTKNSEDVNVSDISLELHHLSIAN